ncbi:SseB family protein [Micromonospora sp. C31]|uniref:SseB family protein n=1 Tax=Micromonospora sp. C31 TaxID=2824876 RepID=UPI001B3678A0|nr:SseB family protein [Micromonospora sp. C31]MBQ1072605.1 SseB family protein [Micromonospora sp. C31]
MTEWEPATDAEAAMRDALRASDQQLYFRVLARTELLLPVSAEALAGTAPVGWGTWTTGGRTHVLAFTSGAAVRACLGENGGTVRRVSYADLADGWPNHEWWLAVNPGLPIEGYLPAWFVAQLSRGDVRLPGRTMGARARLERVETAARARAQTAGHDAPAGADTGPATGVTRSNGTLRPASSTGRVPAPARPGVPVEPAHPRTPPAFPAEHLDPRRGEPAADGPARTDAVPAPERVPPPRPAPFTERPRGLSTPDAHPAPGSNGRSAGEAPERPNRSFFEPASGRAATHRQEALRSGERAAPPSRLAAGSQPFPRRRPLAEPVPEGPTRPIPSAPTGAEPTHAFTVPAGEPTQAFLAPNAEPTHAFTVPAGEPTQAFLAPNAEPTHAFTVPAGEPTRAFAVPGGEATQVLPPREPDEGPTRDLRTSDPEPGPPPAYDGGRPQPAEDVTQAMPRRQATQEPAGPEPVTEAADTEPVSAPPAARRGFTPIVIEGTVIESRDLTGPPAPEPDPAADETVSLFEPVRRRREPVAASPAPPDAAPDPAPPVDPAPSGDATVSLDAASAAAPAWSSDPAADGAARDGAAPATVTNDVGVHGVGPVAAGEDPGPSVADEPVTAPVAVTEPVTAPVPTTEPVTVPVAVTEPVTVPVPTTEPVTVPVAVTEPVTVPVPTTEPVTVPVPTTGPVAGEVSAVADESVGFEPANEVEENLLDAAGAGSTDTFLSTLLLARVLLPVAADSAAGSRPGEPGFVWRTEQLDGETFVVVHTSPERLADHTDAAVETIEVRFVQLIRRWPDESWSFAVNPGTPVGAKLPGEQIVGLASWAAEVGLGDDIGTEAEPPAAEEPVSRPRYAPPAPDPARPIVMQKAVAPSQLAYYLERGYDRVSGFVHRAGELAHLTTPAQLHDALGLGYPESPFVRDAEEIYVLRWPAHRPSLYRIPYGGQNEPAMRAMEGWVIERPPFRGNGFAPGESSDVVAEFKVDSARLPHGAQLWRIGADGTERVVAILDTDALRWRQVGEQ